MSNTEVFSYDLAALPPFNPETSAYPLLRRGNSFAVASEDDALEFLMAEGWEVVLTTHQISGGVDGSHALGTAAVLVDYLGLHS